MAADPGIQKPGKKYGPCVGTCPHKDCEESRYIATQCVCRFCDKVIGFETRFYKDPEARKAPNADYTWCHADCLEDDVHGTRLTSATP